MRTGRAKLFGAGVLLAVAAGGGWLATSRGDRARFRELATQRGDLEVTILSNGIVQPQNQVDIKPPINGRAEQVLVREGARVKKGQVLAWMSSSERAALLDAARAKGEAETKRWESLYKATPILAPIDGTIIDRKIEAGQSFTSQDAVLVMSDRLTVRAQVDETDIAKVGVGQRASVTLDAYPDRKLEAVVDEIAFNAKTVNSVTTYEVDVTPKETPAFVRSGMTANVTFYVEAKRGVVLVPSEAIRAANGKRLVLVKREDGPPEEREIETGASDGKLTEVIEGLADDETVLIPDRRAAGAKGRNPFSPRGGGGGSRGSRGGGH